MKLELKRIPPASVEAALAKATHYREIGRPEEAEGICRDVLDVDPNNPAAWRLLGLAFTDRFGVSDAGLLERAIGAFAKLPDEYDRVFLTGVAWERAGKAHLGRGEDHSAVTALENALNHFAKAEAMRPEQPDPVLRWNHCVRLLSSHPGLLAAIRRPRDHDVRLGD